MAHVPLVPLFVCHANCCRSVLARYLYVHLCQAPAASAGLDAGEWINDRAEGHAHRPLQLSRSMCVAAGAIFVMGPSYLHRLIHDYGEDLAEKCYLFADPFTKPESFSTGHYKVVDPSFDARLPADLAGEFAWMRDRVLQIRQSLLGEGQRLVPVSEYLDLCRTVDRFSH
jgi:protein-tyrosine-phosphatase